MKYVYAILIFSILIIVHEFGHFLLAKKNGVVVEEFSLGLGPRIFSKKIKGTYFSIKPIPFGGSCQMLGEEDNDNVSEGAFSSKKIWQRISIVAAGPIFNFLLALVLSIVMISISGIKDTKVIEVSKNSPAENVGIKKGDIIKEINGYNTNTWDDLILYTFTHSGEKYNLTISRDGKTLKKSLTPKLDKETNQYLMGIAASGKNEKQNILGIVKYSFNELRYQYNNVYYSIRMLINKQASFKDMSGAIGIVSFIGETYEQSMKIGVLETIVNLLELVIMISVSLGVFNLIPFPALDGGRILLLIIEKIRGKKLNSKVEEAINTCGILLLLALMFIVMINDFRFHLF